MSECGQHQRASGAQDGEPPFTVMRSIEFAGQLLKRCLLAQQGQQPGEIDDVGQGMSRSVKRAAQNVKDLLRCTLDYLNSSCSIISSATRLGVINTSFLLRACTAAHTRATVGLGSPTVD